MMCIFQTDTDLHDLPNITFLPKLLVVIVENFGRKNDCSFSTPFLAPSFCH